MNRRIARLAVPLSDAAATACASDGAAGRSRMRSPLSKAPPSAKVKVVVLNVEAERGTVMAGEGTPGDVRRTPNVLQADRGAGRNEILVVADLDTDASFLLDALRPRYRVYVVGEHLGGELSGD